MAMPDGGGVTRSPSGAPGVLAVLRSSGERTADLTLEVLRGLPDTQVEVVTASPLSRSLDITLERTLDVDVELLLVCDADVVPDPVALRRALDDARTLPGHYLQVTVRVTDWLFGSIRTLGIRIYRAQHLAQALDVLREGPDPRRPESSMITEMARRGRPSARTLSVAGIHDRGQWRRDVYRTAYFASHKHAEKLSHLVPRWREMVARDDDFRVALLGLGDGLVGLDPNADVDAFDRGTIDERLESIGIGEKDDLAGAERVELSRAAAAEAGNEGRGGWLTNPLPDEARSQWAEFRRNGSRSTAARELGALHRRRGFGSLPRALVRSLRPPAAEGGRRLEGER